MNAGRRRHPLIGSTRRGPSASVGNAWARVVAAGLIIGLALSGCVARPVGDFGRAKPSVLHDDLMPAVGSFMARQRGEPVSGFNQTDQEREMHDRTWRFLIAPHARDWMFDASVELQRTRIGRAQDFRFTLDRYYSWLRTTRYQSSTTRYATVGRHILADLDTLPDTFRAICAVIEVDRQRQVALASLPAMEPGVAADVAARRTENQWHIDWFTRALTYRYRSYSYALDHLLVETPHEQSMAVDETLRRMGPWVERANRGDFCSGAVVARGATGFTIPSRFQTMVYDREIVDQK
ncbi:hypothetical protein IC608_07705 [Devosia sp. PTR5]|uniref:Uncharacterized protein n=1 Tax=Devosia oryzisoli TaxID=2774138 RepID=A0A927IT52_9HYPH|nr:hypothetical protein [Devosia oryzisoli]MBD8065356.1 hypothetical protein [Devosia oryzisoli]